jgi:hypothetical protein
VADEKKTPEQTEDPAPGWYPDPVDSEGLRYWDGKRWTVERAGAPAETPAGAPAAAAPAQAPQRVGGVAWGVYATFGAFLLFSVANLLYTLDYSDALGAAIDGETIGVGEANDKFDAFNAVSGLGLLFAIALAIGFLIWFHRAYANAAGLTRRPLRYGTGWSVGAWFIPIFNLWRPKQIANDVWRAGDPKARDNSEWNALPVAGLVHWWWAIWILGSAIAGAGGGLLAIDSPLVEHAEAPGSVGDSELEQEYAATTLVAAGAAVQMIGAVMAMMVVRRASERQDALISGSTA